MSTVELSFSPLPAHVRTARLIASAVARRVGVDAQVLDEVRLAVGEACTRAVELHRRSGVTDLIRVSFSDGPTRFVISVEDCARAADPDVPAPGSDALAELARTADVDGEDALFEPLPAGVGIAVIGELVDDLDVEITDSGTSVCMSWPLVPVGTTVPGDLGAPSTSQ
ncbi:MAG TPA: ATP-binding protein [Actinomycetes bacterium]|nr:ATP-binding protein [Actinomycetes bacterium]